MRSRRQRSCSASIMLLCVFLPMACGSLHAGDSPSDACVTDDLQRSVCAKDVPTRIISFAPDLTELVFALDAGDYLKGRTQRCNVPPEALNVPEIGGYLNPDLERVLATKPDLVLTNRSATRKEVVDRLVKMGIPVFVADAKTIDGVCSVVTRVGTLLRREGRAREIVTGLEKRRRTIQSQASASNRPTVLLAVGIRPLVVAGGQSFIGALIREAGGINIAEDAAKPFVRYNIEEVVKRDPDVILVLNKECTGAQCVELWREHDLLTAVRKDRVYPLDADLMARASPRIIDGLEELARILRSQLFEGSSAPKSR